MNRGELAVLRSGFHRRIFREVLRRSAKGIPNNADSGSRSSMEIANGIIDQIGLDVPTGKLAGQTAGRLFELATRGFLSQAFGLLKHLRPGDWEFEIGRSIDQYEQYAHLKDVRAVVEQDKSLLVAFGDYIIKPDIVVARCPASDHEINERVKVLGDESIAQFTPLCRSNTDQNTLHASVSCKWTIRSDRSQNARTEGLNLIRNRKGRTPYIVVVVGEPLPGRIASLALGTGDIDCVYHFALAEAREVAAGSDLDMLDTLVEGGRLRDISDLPFDLAL